MKAYIKDQGEKYVFINVKRIKLTMDPVNLEHRLSITYEDKYKDRPATLDYHIALPELLDIKEETNE